MEFLILGNLEAEAHGERLALGGWSERKVLAVLLLNAGRMVPVEYLVHALWDEGPPATAVKQVRNSVGRLRRLLASGGGPDLILTEGAGYRIRAEGNGLDARLFEQKVAQAEAAVCAGDTREAAALLRCALDLWRGPALAGLSGQVNEAAAGAWNERRCAVEETYYDHRLALGDHLEIVGDLRALVSARLMLALYRCGRRADALEAYSRVRAGLASELGLDPGPPLRRLHQQILAADPGLELPAAHGGPRARRPGVRRPGAGTGRGAAAAARRGPALRRPPRGTGGADPAA
jgi:DNA-binding SARP family transcriptional activator